MAIELNKIPAFGFETQDCCYERSCFKKDNKRKILITNIVKVVSYIPIISAIIGVAILILANVDNGHLSKAVNIRAIMNILHLSPFLIVTDVAITIARQIKILTNQN